MRCFERSKLTIGQCLRDAHSLVFQHHGPLEFGDDKAAVAAFVRHLKGT